MKIRPCVFTAAIALAASAGAQTGAVDLSAELRAKYGPPLARETFVIPAGEMVVDYGSGGHICRIGFPAIAPDPQRPNVKSTKAMDEFILGVVPAAVRGKELRRGFSSTGVPGISFVEYENVTVAESLQGTRRTGITVTFTHESCGGRPVP